MFRSTQTNYRDSKICVDYLCGLCPYELLSGSPTGVCIKEHNPLIKAQYESDVKSDPSKTLDNEHLLSLSQFLNRRDQSSLGWNHRIHSVHPMTEKVQNLKSHMDTVTIQWMLAMNIVDHFDGTVDKNAISTVMADVHKRDKERQKLKSTLDATLKGLGFITPVVRLCEVCGTFIPSKMPPDHLNSKIHLAYTKIRDTVTDIKLKRDTRVNQQIL
ncbi:hypothetical protein BDC45DRAFT_501552 [Circinella umbellata]|nr:hypothetical protein BDC45DRAFT_501552 [Circinella umbellata]